MALAHVCLWISLFSFNSRAISAAPLTPPDRIKKADKLAVAIDATYPPMEMEGDDGKAAGFDVDLAKIIAERLGVQAEFLVMSWDGIISGLNSKRYDLIASAMNITEDRKQTVAFVEYLRMAQIYVAAPPLVITKAQDLNGKQVAVQADTTSATYVEKVKKDGIANFEIKAFKNATDILAAVRAKQANVAVIDEPVGRYFVKQDPEHFKITGKALAAEPVGLAMRKDDLELIKVVTQVVAELKADGTMKKLQMTWFGSELGQ